MEWNKNAKKKRKTKEKKNKLKTNNISPVFSGIALGLDRLIALLVGAPSIRSVLAFPKSAGGREAMTGAPAEVDEAELVPYHVRLGPDAAAVKNTAI